MAIEITEAALKQIKIHMEANGLNQKTAFLRMGVKGDGCSGLSYSLELETEVALEDKVFEFTLPGCGENYPKFKILVDPKSYLYLNGTTIDYVTQGLAGGFIFINPNAKSTCGCGSSFSPE